MWSPNAKCKLTVHSRPSWNSVFTPLPLSISFKKFQRIMQTKEFFLRFILCPQKCVVSNKTIPLCHNKCCCSCKAVFLKWCAVNFFQVCRQNKLSKKISQNSIIIIILIFFCTSVCRQIVFTKLACRELKKVENHNRCKVVHYLIWNKNSIFSLVAFIILKC